MSGGARKGAGRKLLEIDLEQLEKLCVIQCTNPEIAAFFGVSTRTIEIRRKDAEFEEVMTRGYARGCISVRRAQMKLVEAGNARMAIWLGKHLLGQRDSVPVELSGPHGQSIQFSLEVIDAILALATKKRKS